MSKFYARILSQNQKSVLSKVSFLKKDKFYLAGGTALALQLGHRTSVDLDFYSPKHFDPKKLYIKIENLFKNEVVKTGQAKDTLFCKIEGVESSFFWYSHPLTKKPKKFEGVLLASLEDISAMKLVAISKRPVKRDYLDIYFLLEKFDLDKMLRLSNKKYPNFNFYYSLRALTYFKDVEKEEKKRPVKIFAKNFSWEAAKEKIFTEVKKYQLSMLKKK